MADQEALNYPDVLGAITGGVRLNLDVIQAALAVRPAQVAAGAYFEIVLVVQNASDVDVDVLAEPILPDRDAAHQKSHFLTKSSHLRIGLCPAEVGYLTLPVSTSPKTAPAPGYPVGIQVAVKRLGKNPQRVRLPGGGGAFTIQELPQPVQQQIEALRALAFSARPCSKKNTIQTTVDILPPALSSLKELKPGWRSLWSMQDYLDDATIAGRVAAELELMQPYFHRDKIFLPLLKATQSHFEASGYPLHPPEAIFIAKLLTLLIEQGPVPPVPGDGQGALPRWYSHMCHLLLREPALVTQPEGLIATLAFPSLAHDAVRHAFAMVKTVTGESFGSADETLAYAEDVARALEDGAPLDLAHVYLPLIMGGVIANARVTVPNEQVRDTAFALSKALDLRRAEQTAANAFVLNLTDKLIERALESA